MTTDELLKSKLADYLTHLESAARAGGDFAARELPDVVQQMVSYHLGMGIAGIAGGLMALIAGMALVAYIYRYAKKDRSAYEPDLSFLMFLGSILCFFLALGMITANLSTVLQCWLAPKYFILQQLANLLKS